MFINTSSGDMASIVKQCNQAAAAAMHTFTIEQAFRIAHKIVALHMEAAALASIEGHDKQEAARDLNMFTSHVFKGCNITPPTVTIINAEPDSLNKN